MTTRLLSRRLLYCLNVTRAKQVHHHPNISCFSTGKPLAGDTSQHYEYDISQHVQGVSKADVEGNPALAAYLAANTPDIFVKEEDKKTFTDIILEENPHLVPLVDHYNSLEPTKVKKKTRHTRERAQEPEIGDVEATTEPQRGLKLQQERQDNISNFNIRPLFGYTRDNVTEEGTRRCNRLRIQKLMVPGLIYGNDPTQSIDSSSKRIFVKTPWSELQRELDLYTHNHLESRVYDLTIYDSENPDSDDEGTVYRVLPRDIQYHPVKNKLYCCNYLRYHPGRTIKVPIVYTNEEESPAMKRGGFIAPFNRFVPCIVDDGVPIPEQIELDCTGMKLKEVARLDRIILPEGVSLAKKVDRKNFLVGTVFGKRADIGIEENTEEVAKVAE